MSTERKDVLIRKAGNLARKYTHVWRPTPKIPLSYDSFLGFIDGSVVKNPPAVQEMQVRSLGWEDSLEKEMATHSSILSWKISWTEEPGELQSMES